MKVIGVDVDGTLTDYKQWAGVDHIDSPLPGAVEFIATLRRNGWTVCLWSTRAEVYLREWAKRYGIVADHFNESPLPTDSGKQSFDLYLGDEALRFSGDFAESLAQIEQIGHSRHWGPADTFVRWFADSDRNPEVYYRGTGQLYLDVFNGLTEQLWKDRAPKEIALLTICSHAKPYSKSWIHSEIKRHLHRSGIAPLDYIHISSAGIIPADACHSPSIVNRYDWDGSQVQLDEVKDMLRRYITRRLKAWYEIIGHRYAERYLYLRPSGNTMKAVQDSNVPVVIVPVVELRSPPWQDFPDADDCLADFVNLNMLGALLNVHQP